MNKRKIFIILLLLVFVSGCSNVKFLGKKLNKEEVIINNKKIDYLESIFANVNVTFTGRTQGSRNCECEGGSIDGSCLDEVCEIVPNKYVWHYDICSNLVSYYCSSASYDDVEEEWIIGEEEEFKFVNAVLDILNKNNVNYNTFNSDSNIRYYIMIKKEKNIDNLINAVKEIEKYYLSVQDNDLSITSTEITIFNEDDYNYILKHTSKNTDVFGNYTLYEILSGHDNFGMNIGKRSIDDNMFECSSSKYEHISYELSFWSDSDVEIWCTGIK